MMRKYFSLLPFIILSVGASFLNYITYPILSRVLPDAQFVDVTVSLTLLTQISSFLSSIVALAIAYTKHNEEDPTKAVESLQSSLIRFFVILIVVFLCLSPFLINIIHIAPIFLLPVCLLLIFSIPVATISGFLNGRQRLLQLGLVAAVTSASQFIFAISTALISNEGAPTLIAMSLGQLAAIFILYLVLKKEKLPKLRSLFTRGPSLPKRTLIYAFFVSIGVMAINILQILDLLIVKSFQIDEIFYTDLSIVSRLVFFSGTILLWPFLGAIDVKNLKANILLFTKYASVVIAIGVISTSGLWFFGDTIVQLLTGSSYGLDSVRKLGIPALFLKIGFVLHTSITLYFIVQKHKYAVIHPLIVSIVTIAAALTVNINTPTESIVNRLNVACFISLAISYALFLHSCSKRAVSVRKHSQK